MLLLLPVWSVRISVEKEGEREKERERAERDAAKAAGSKKYSCSRWSSSRCCGQQLYAVLGIL
jgi:hypothetical protein